MAQVAKIVSINEASAWASEYLGRNVTPSNISYLMQYGRVRKIESNGKTYVDIDDLLKYYNSYIGRKEAEWKEERTEQLKRAEREARKREIRGMGREEKREAEEQDKREELAAVKRQEARGEERKEAEREEERTEQLEKAEREARKRERGGGDLPQ